MYPSRHPRLRQQGFTLIELLVVIAIISILAGILLPAFAQAREKGRQTACLSNIKQLSTAFMMYAQDYDEGFPAGGVGGGIAPCTPTKSSSWVLQQTIDMTTSKCARANQPVPNGALYTYVKNDRVYVCPSDQFAEDKTLSYSMNSNLDGQGLPQLQAPSNCVLLVDEGKTLNDGYFAAPSGYAAPSPMGPFDSDQPSLAHNGGANFAYADGHAKWAKPTMMTASKFSYSASE